MMDGWMGGTPHFTSLRFAESSRVEGTNERPVESGTRVCSCVCVRVFVCARGKRKNGDSVEEDLVSWRLILHLASYILNLSRPDGSPDERDAGGRVRHREPAGATG